MWQILGMTKRPLARLSSKCLTWSSHDKLPPSLTPKKVDSVFTSSSTQLMLSTGILFNDSVKLSYNKDKKEEDILQEMGKEKFEDIIAFLQDDVPVSLTTMNLVKNYCRDDKTQETELKIYCPRGDISSGLVIVTLTYLNKCGYKFVELYCREDSTSIIQEALLNTRRLFLNDVITYVGTRFFSKYFPYLEQVLQKQNIQYTRKTGDTCLFLPRESYDNWLKQNLNVPDEFYIRPLTGEDATLIDETWHYHSATTYDFVHHSIVFLGGLGLAHKSNGQLVSWVVEACNAGGMAYTLPDYRHRGFAEIVIKALGRKKITLNVQPWCVVRSNNIPSLSLVKKMGFCEFGEYYAFHVKR